jgi:hypothetical protein
MHACIRPWLTAAAYALAIALGLVVAGFDVAAPFGDDTAQGTVLLWLLSCGTLGVLLPCRPWRWAVLVGPWVAAVHAARLALGLPGALHPNTYATALILLPVSLAVCLAAAYAGAFARRAGQAA